MRIEFENGSVINSIDAGESKRGLRTSMPFILFDNFQLTKWQIFKLNVLDIKLKVYKRLLPSAYYKAIRK